MQVCCVVYVHVWERHYGSVVGVEGGGEGIDVYHVHIDEPDIGMSSWFTPTRSENN